MPLPAPWPYRADRPQRYNDNYARYFERGGKIRLEEFVKGFVAEPRGKRGDMARFYFFCLAFDQIIKEAIPGDLAELGVYQGHTAAVLAQFARLTGRTLYLLDTFNGFSDLDLAGIDATKSKAFSDTSLDRVQERVGTEAVRYVAGRFPQTAAHLPADARYALVHIDCDLHAPISAGLAYFYPRMSPGGFLIIHDYSSLHWDGAEKAVDEFFSDKPEFILPMTDGAGSAVVRKCV